MRFIFSLKNLLEKTRKFCPLLVGGGFVTSLENIEKTSNFHIKFTPFLQKKFEIAWFHFQC